mmetsp:Transcript_42622/g.129082  ORF Transcript_42622/g.129082 Transcript_42622/m.129082 type:complete len:282 (+) Transcript_42622:666-1511(+)
MVPRLGHVVLEGSEGGDKPLDVHLELRRRKVEATHNPPADVLVREVAAQDGLAEALVLHEGRHGCPTLGLHDVQELQGLLGGRQKKPPVGDVVLRRDGVEVARSQREEVVVDEDVLRLAAEGHDVGEALGRPAHSEEEGAEDVFRLADLHFLQACPAGVARGEGESTRLAALFTHLHVVVQRGHELGVRLGHLVDGPIDGVVGLLVEHRYGGVGAFGLLPESCQVLTPQHLDATADFHRCGGRRRHGRQARAAAAAAPGARRRRRASPGRLEPRPPAPSGP